jgi:Predicted hydrolase (metallo-beta-lactamase superfamily)
MALRWRICVACGVDRFIAVDSLVLSTWSHRFLSGKPRRCSDRILCPRRCASVADDYAVPPVGRFVFNNANWTLATLVIGIVHLFAQIPGGHFYVGQPDWGGRSTKITVLDLGAGAAVHVRVNGHDWLIDCGSERSYDRVVRQYLHWAGVNRLTGLVLTRRFAAHRWGHAIVERFPTGPCDR